MADSNNEHQRQEDEEAPKEVTTNQNSSKQDNRERVRRRLDFGDADPIIEMNAINEMLHLSSSEMYKQRLKAIEKWNFDFENEVPLDGDWEWEKVPTQMPENKEIVSNMEDNTDENRTV